MKKVLLSFMLALAVIFTVKAQEQKEEFKLMQEERRKRMEEMRRNRGF